jgi:hypothetical protein
MSQGTPERMKIVLGLVRHVPVQYAIVHAELHISALFSEQRQWKYSTRRFSTGGEIGCKWKWDSCPVLDGLLPGAPASRLMPHTFCKTSF